MKKHELPLPAELQAFINQGQTMFQCVDGEWDLRICPGDKSPFCQELPDRAVMIAENGCGDCLFLRSTANGKIEPKVFVYWHEEDRSAVFAKHVKELTESKVAPVQETSKPEPASTVTLTQVEAAVAAGDSTAAYDVFKQFRESNFGLEALPFLRKVLCSDSVTLALEAARCIAKLGPAALSSPAGADKSNPQYANLELQLFAIGSKRWSYSGYPNCYSECLKTMLKLKVNEDYIIGHIRTHIGLSSPDDLIHSLEALREIGTPKAIDLIKRAAVFWMPDLNIWRVKSSCGLIKYSVACGSGLSGGTMQSIGQSSVGTLCNWPVGHAVWRPGQRG